MINAIQLEMLLISEICRFVHENFVFLVFCSVVLLLAGIIQSIKKQKLGTQEILVIVHGFISLLYLGSLYPYIRAFAFLQ